MPMRRAYALLSPLFLLTVVACARDPRPGTAEKVTLPGTTLLVALPQDWEIGATASPGINSTGLRFAGTPAFQITAGELTKKSRIPGVNQPMMIAGSNLLGDCNMFFATMSALKDAHQEPISELLPRPAFMPVAYYSLVLAPKPVEKRKALSVCLDRGDAVDTIFIVPAPEEKDSGKLTAVLQSIADAAKEKSTLLYAPVSVDLPILGAKVALSRGVWELGHATDSPTSTNRFDVLNRTSGPIGLRLIPMMAPTACGQLISAMRAKGSTIVQKPEYLGAAWFPQAAEVTDNTRASMMISACLQLQPNNALTAVVLYSSNSIAQGDAGAIAEMLDATAAGIREKMKSSPLR